MLRILEGLQTGHLRWLMRDGERREFGVCFFPTEVWVDLPLLWKATHTQAGISSHIYHIQQLWCGCIAGDHLYSADFYSQQQETLVSYLAEVGNGTWRGYLRISSSQVHRTWTTERCWWEVSNQRIGRHFEQFCQQRKLAKRYVSFWDKTFWCIVLQRHRRVKQIIWQLFIGG